MIYKPISFRNKTGAVDLLHFIIHNNLEDIFLGTFKHIRIIKTIVMT